ncbi:HAD-like protein [Glarea lozoyensis ATCC 20868]|uniref:phosphoserine phosphatase n=2 Tax=Glarea lozoyensis TaxID=101852 RepID=S3DJ57_GLAL2|nr:HAD-like protein [Glarea lozoyensis ATCC 20868]EHK97574.1 putative phosphoserine phosphatase [Glarea lozoyensis 74030]EPE32071.1 HAD-like protein [Glarea lozoyensis ATCC 20868]
MTDYPKENVKPPGGGSMARAIRPSLGGMRSSSYLQEHQQYRPPQPDGHEGIDSIVERTQNAKLSSSPSRKQFNGVPSPGSPPKIIDSGLNHSLSHANCQPAPGTKTDRIVATIMYKKPHIENTSDLSIDRSPSPAKPPTRSIPPNMAPTRTLSQFPLEPPPPDPEPLDHLYGSYISPLCLTSFLHLIASLPSKRGSETLTSSHRCLDNPLHPSIVELTFSPTPDPEYVSLEDLRRHELLYRFEREWNVDVVLQADTVTRRYPRLVVFDMDSTLIQEEVIDLIAASIGVEKEVSAITTRAMNGELDFSASFKERVALLKGVDAEIFTKLRNVITPTNGVRELIRALKKIGVKTAVLSGGFIPLTQWLATSLGIDYAFANTLAIDPATNTLTGEVLGDIVNAERKRDLLLQISKEVGADKDQVLAVGDGANDLLMMGAAGLGVAWNAKPVVQMQAQARLNGGSLLDLLFLFGFTGEEVGVLTK